MSTVTDAGGGEADDSAVTRLLAELIRIDSGNPVLAAAAPGERRIVEHLVDWLKARGFEVEVIGRDAGRPSILATLRGSGGGRTLLLNGHLDTVPGAGYDGSPFEPNVENGRMYGRGSYDMKSGLAAALVAAERASRRGLAGDVVVSLVADEEFGSIGTEDALAALAGRRVDGAIVTEPTGLALTVAHRGFAWFRLEVAGVAAHGSQPELGVDAIEAALDLIAAIRAYGQRLAADPAHPLLGRSSVRIATISGGTDAATVADRCTVILERRTLPGESPDAVRRALEDVLAKAAAPVAARWRLEQLVSRPAFEAPQSAPIVQSIVRAYEAPLGEPPERRGDPWWTDAGLIAEAGIPVVLLGVDGGGAHADREWVLLDSLHALTAVLETTIVDFCGAADAGGRMEASQEES